MNQITKSIQTLNYKLSFVLLALIFSLAVQAQSQNVSYEGFQQQDWQLVEFDENAKVGSLNNTPLVLPNGSAGYNLSIEVPAGNGGIQPSLSVSY
ncbi:MAG: hypothetical protein ACPG4W_07710, partial [Flavobacteriales bacterium]